MNATSHLTPHLTDDQIDDALIGDLSAFCATHLAACDKCRHRLVEAQAPIASFNAVSLAWSERQSATMPWRQTPSAASVWLSRALWAATAAGALAIGISIPVIRHSAERSAGSNPGTPALMASTGPVDNPVAAREEQIVRDNQMLESIDRELTGSGSLDQEYGLRAASRHTSLPVRN